MLEHLKTEGKRGTPQTRLMVYMAAVLVLGGVIIAVAIGAGRAKQVPDEAPLVVVEPVELPPIDASKLPAEDSTSSQARYQTEALAYLLTLVDRDYSPWASRLSLADLAALPYGEAIGQVFETEGTVESINQEEWQGQTDRLWSVLLTDASGARTIVLKHGYRSDAQAGRPEDAYRLDTQYVQEGDRYLVRGVYLQRRAGTFGEAILRDPVPVLVATPPTAAFRKLPTEKLAPIDEPDEADWDMVQDRFLQDTQVFTEPALYQIVQWARRRGHAQILEDIRSGKLPARHWGRDLFDAWGEEVENQQPDVGRPLTESLRGRLFETTGLIGSFQREGWETVPHGGDLYDVDKLYVLDLIGDYWAHQALRNASAFPLETFEGVTGDPQQQVRVYGFFLKNHTYPGRKVRGGGPAAVTMPMFVIVHVEPLPEHVSPYQTLVWILAGTFVALFLVFWLVFIRGESKEAARHEAFRRDLRRRRTAAGGGPLASVEKAVSAEKEPRASSSSASSSSGTSPADGEGPDDTAPGGDKTEDGKAPGDPVPGTDEP